VVQKAIEIPIESRPDVGTNVPSQNVVESEKTPRWAFDNINYFITFYNRRTNYLNFPQATGIDGRNEQAMMEKRISPVQTMIRMMLYYLGMQPNMDYAFVTDDLTRTTMQSMWIRNQTVKEFVDYFTGNMLARVSNAEWTAKPLSKRAQSERADAFDKEMLKFDLKPYLAQLKESFGADFGKSDFDLPEQVKEWMETDWKEYGAELCTDMANGIWFTERWSSKAIEAFKHVVTCALCAMHHYVERGRAKQEILMPYQVIFDNRRDNDYGYYDQFAGKIGVGTPNEIFSLFPELDAAQRKDIETMAQDKAMQRDYNVFTPNLTWWSTGNNTRNTVTYVTMYWRTKRFVGKKKVFKEDGNPRIAKVVDPFDPDQYIYEDVYQGTVIGNKYLVRYGYVDNLVEEFGNVSRPSLPIIRFRPNTFLGESKSEVERIHKIIDEIDYLDYKIREMVGKSKGKVYWVNGEKLGEGVGVKEFLEDIAAMGVHVGVPNGEDDDRTPAVEYIDMTLDPNFDKLWTLIQQKEDKMKRILSTSDIALGQPQEYMGFNTTQSTISQNAIGTAYLFDGFMEWLVLNMRYAVNQSKLIYTNSDSNEASFIVGDRGLVFLKLFKSLRFEEIFTKLNINDQMDEKQKQRIIQIAQAVAQNQGISMLDYLKIEKSSSVTEAENILEYSLKEQENKQSKQAQAEQEAAGQLDQSKVVVEAALQQLKDDNANYRAEVQALSKNIGDLLKLMQNQPPASPLQAQMAQGEQPPMQEAPAQEAQDVQQPMAQ